MGDAAVHLQEAVNRWQSSINYMQQNMGNANAFVGANPQFAQTPLNYGSAVNNAQQWLDSARQALATQDQGSDPGRASRRPANAWRGVDPNALRRPDRRPPGSSRNWSSKPFPSAEVLTAEAPAVIPQVAVPIGRSARGRGAGDRRPGRAERASAGHRWGRSRRRRRRRRLVVDRDPGRRRGGRPRPRQVGTCCTSSCRRTTRPRRRPSRRRRNTSAALPDPGLTGDEPPPVETPLPTPLPTPSEQTPEAQTPEAQTPVPQTPVPTPVAQPEPVPAPSPRNPRRASPTPTPTPTPCALPNSIGVTGGDHSSLGPSGGSFTVTSTPVVLSANAVDCGDPYRLSFGASRPSGGTVSGASCHPHGDISYNISSGPNPVQVGDSVTVNLEAPPNSCEQTNETGRSRRDVPRHLPGPPAGPPRALGPAGPDGRPRGSDGPWCRCASRSPRSSRPSWSSSWVAATTTAARTRPRPPSSRRSSSPRARHRGPTPSPTR